MPIGEITWWSDIIENDRYRNTTIAKRLIKPPTKRWGSLVMDVIRMCSHIRSVTIVVWYQGRVKIIAFGKGRCHNTTIAKTLIEPFNETVRESPAMDVICRINEDGANLGTSVFMWNVFTHSICNVCGVVSGWFSRHSRILIVYNPDLSNHIWSICEWEVPKQQAEWRSYLHRTKGVLRYDFGSLDAKVYKQDVSVIDYNSSWSPGYQMKTMI